MALSISQFRFGPRSLVTSTGRPASELSRGSSGWISTRISDDRSALVRLVLLTILPERMASSTAHWQLPEIGRESCRPRVSQYRSIPVGAVRVIKKPQKSSVEDDLT